MMRNEWRQGNRLPCGAMTIALVIGVWALTASRVESLAIAPTAAERTEMARLAAPVRKAMASLPPSGERLAKRFGVRRELAAVIYEQARLAKVTPAMAFGVIAAESGFDPGAIGHHGERGLMQIKPSTAQAYDEWITAEALHDPVTNVRLGLKHLKREVEYFGDPVLGLMSYHMGRTRLEREMADGIPPRDRYVERVLSICGRDCA